VLSAIRAFQHIGAFQARRKAFHVRKNEFLHGNEIVAFSFLSMPNWEDENSELLAWHFHQKGVARQQKGIYSKFLLLTDQLQSWTQPA